MTAVLERRAQPDFLPDSIAAAHRKYSWSRLAKLGGAFVILGLGAYAVWSDQTSISTDNAIVSAYTVAVRAPMEGILTIDTKRVGDRVDRGDLIGIVANVLFEDQHLL
jgi:multidrug resistance efflux pump